MTRIALLGQPGCGKTSTGKILAKVLGLKFIDIDDDIYEQRWGCTVAQKLSQMTDDEFLDLEDETLSAFIDEGAGPDVVIALSGSNPCRPKAMEKLRSKNFTLIWLDSPESDILQRLERMKVNRIVGQASMGMAQVLPYRRQFYEKYYHLRAFIGHDWTVEEQAGEAEAVLRASSLFSGCAGKMQSTRNRP